MKGNIGHLEGAAGVASLIKVCLMLQHSAIPPQANFKTPNQNLGDISKSNIVIPTSTIAWKAKHKVACINNYGAAGSNSAMIVCQPPLVQPASQSTVASRGLSYPLLISGNGPDAIEANFRAILKHARQLEQKRVPSVAASLAHALATSQNRSLSHALVVTISDNEDLEATLTKNLRNLTQLDSKSKQAVVLCFGGQSKSFVGLDKQLFDSSSLLQTHLRKCDSVMRSLGYPGVFPAIFQTEPVEDPVQLHGILFALQYSSAKAWLDSGLQVDAIVGHSFGQLTGLTVAGALSLEDGVKLVCGRARLIQTLWGPVTGAMIAIEASSAKVQEIISKVSRLGYDAEIACHNACESHVVVGTVAAVDAIETSLAETGIKHKRLPVTHGFHSVFTEPLLPGLRELAQNLQFKTPSIPIETCTEDRSWTKGTPDLIVQHTRHPVYFHHAIERLSARLGPCTWIEASTGSSAPAMVKRCLSTTSADNFIHANLGTKNASASLAEATASLWRCNQSVQFWPFHAMDRERYASINLPGYQFRQTKHWLEWQDSVVPSSSPDKETKGSEPERHDLLTFSSYQDSAKSVAWFNVDPQNEKFQLLVKGHAVVGQPLCPAPLYCELAIGAARYLSPDMTSDAPEIQDLKIHAPLGLKNNGTLRLVMESSSIPNQWNFTVKSVTDNGADTTHAHGLVALSAGSVSIGNELASYQRLIGYERINSLVTDFDCDALRGSATYKAFNRVVNYSPYYKGVQAIYGRLNEACGRIELPASEHKLALEREILTPLHIDNFFQVAGLQINVLQDCDDHLVFVCTETQRILAGPEIFQNPAARYEVYSTISRNGPKEVLSDVIVFEPVSKNVVFVALGARFTRVSIEGLRKALRNANGEGPIQQQLPKSPRSSSAHVAEPAPRTPIKSAEYPAKREGRRKLAHNTDAKPSVPKVDYLAQVKALLNKVSDVPVNEIQSGSTLDDLGIDSLMVMEVQTEVHSQFKLSIPNKDWATLETPQKLADYLEKSIQGTVGDDKLPTAQPVSILRRRDSAQGSDGSSSSDEFSSGDGETDVRTGTTTPGLSADADSSSLIKSSSHSPKDINEVAQQTFSDMRGNYDEFATEEGFSNFWRDVYPLQKKLTLAYVVDAFATMGCDLKTVSAGQVLPSIEYLPQQESLVKQLYVILQDSSLIVAQNGTHCRTGVPIDTTPAAVLLDDILRKSPQHAEEHKLLEVTGSRLGDCLLGRADPLRLLFMDKANKNLLESVYANGPMYKAMSRLLGSYITETISRWQGHRPLRVLEIGGGTGGTTRHIVQLLQQQNIDFTYCFSDVSRGLVSNAKRKFSMYPQMEFAVLDIEQPPSHEYIGKYDLILSTNCIHATKDLQITATNIRQMLNQEGFICLVEFTRNIFWFDLVFGLLDGWWLFEDGRTHVLADESFWDKSLRAAGFGDVQWTEGDSEESKTLRLISGFNIGDGNWSTNNVTASGRRGWPDSRTVCWKRVGDLELMVDIYLPDESQASDKSRPIGKSI